MTQPAHTIDTPHARIIVLCWSYENRLDQSGPLGYSFHLTEENASEWKENPGAKLSKYVHNANNGFMICSLCGKGFVNEAPSQKLLKDLESGDGVYEGISSRDICQGTPSWLTLTSGESAGQVRVQA